MNLSATFRNSQLFTFWRWFWRQHEPERGRIVLYQRRVYVLPTRHGISFAVALILMLVGSINYNLSLGYVMTFLLAGMAIVSILHTFRNLAHLAIDAGRVDDVFAGETAQFEIHIHNDRADARRDIWIRCEDAPDRQSIPAERTLSVRIPVRAARRGWLQLPRVTLETTYPLGMFRAWSYVQPDMRALVYPQPDAAPLPPPSPNQDRGDSINVGGGNDDFSGLRGYQPSDSPRHIAWKAVARGDTMLTKSFMGRAGEEMIFDWSQLPDHLDLEARLSRLARWVLLADDAGMSFSLRLPGENISMGMGEEHRRRCLRALALHQAAA
jgi:uncharacterized protein (DUF58 family)